MAEWTGFETWEETAQARFLLDVAQRALPALGDFPQEQARIAQYLTAGVAVLGGDIAQHPHLCRFLADPEMTDDFNVYFNTMQGHERAMAALDLATYACGFTARIMAPAAGDPTLSDPVLEAQPDIYDYFEGRAALLDV